MSNRRSPPSQSRNRGLACSRFCAAAATSQPRGWLDKIPPARVADTRGTAFFPLLLDQDRGGGSFVCGFPLCLLMTFDLVFFSRWR